MKLGRFLLKCVAVEAALIVIGLAALSQHDEYFDAQVLISAARAVLSGQSPYGVYFQSPLWTALLLVPFAALPGGAAYEAWFVANVACWVTACLLLAQVTVAGGSRLDRLVTASLLLLFPPVLWAAHGQVVGFMALGLAAFLWLHDRRPFVAGAALALLAVKPHLALLAWAVILVQELRAGRLRLLGGLVAGTGALLATSLLVEPGWPLRWLEVVLGPPAEIVRDRALYTPAVWAAAGLWAQGWLASAFGWLVAMGVVLFAARDTLRLQPDAKERTVALAVPALFLAAPYSQGYDLALLVFPLALLWNQVERTWGRRGDAVGRVRAGAVRGMLVALYLFPVVVVFTDWPQPVLVLCPVLALAAYAVSRSPQAGAVLRAGQREVSPA